MPHDLRKPVERSSSLQVIRQPFFQLIKHIMLGGGVDPLMPQCLLRLANIPLGELRAHKPPDVMRFDMLNLF